MGLKSLLIGGLQRLEQMLCLTAVVTVETPIAPIGEGKRKAEDEMKTDGLYLKFCLCLIKEKTVLHSTKKKTAGVQIP